MLGGRRYRRRTRSKSPNTTGKRKIRRTRRTRRSRSRRRR